LIRLNAAPREVISKEETVDDILKETGGGLSSVSLAALPR